MSNVVTYGEIVIEPYELTDLYELQIVNQFNEHATMMFTGIVSETINNQYVNNTNEESSVSVYKRCEDGTKIDLFHGLIQSIEVEQTGELFQIKAEAVSHTYKLDTENVNQSFQDVQMSYEDLIETVVEGKAMCIDRASNGEKIGQPILQYLETDWQFLKRMASRFSTGLVPASSLEGVKFYFGIPSSSSKGEIEAKNYIARKKLEQYYACKPWIEDLSVNDFLSYEVTSEQLYEIGDVVEFQERKFVVKFAKTMISRSILENQYILVPGRGTSQPRLHNLNIVGASLSGKVIGVKKDKVQVHFNLDKQQDPNKAYWWPYATVLASKNGSGWFCMPELSDDVRVYYPSYREEDAIATSSVPKE